MLGGNDPVIIFQFSKLAPSLADTIAKIPVVSQIPTLIEQPPIPVYLREQTFGILIDAESKNVDIRTETETKSDGSDPDVTQKGIQNSITVSVRAKKDSIGISLMSALMDYAFDKVGSKEYAITYLHGPITVFRGLLISYSADQNPDNDMIELKFQLTKGTKDPVKPADVPVVSKITGALPL